MRLKQMLLSFIVFTIIFTIGSSITAYADKTVSASGIYEDYYGDNDDEYYDEGELCIDDLYAINYSKGIRLTIDVWNPDELFSKIKVYVKKPGASQYAYLGYKEYYDSNDESGNNLFFHYYYHTDKSATYKFKVIAVDMYGRSLDTMYLTYQFNNIKAPSITVKAQSSNTIKITWNRISGAKGYKVYRAASSSGPYKLIKTINSNSICSYTNKTPKKNRRYYYKVKAYSYVDGDTVTGSPSSVKSALAGVLKTSITSIKSYSGQVTLKWDKSSKAAGYEVYRAYKKSGPYVKIKTTKNRSFTDKNVTSGHRYYYKVKAYRYINGKKYRSSYSNSRNKKVNPRSYTYTKARKAYIALKGACYYPDTLRVNNIYSGKVYGDKVIMIDYNAENSYGISIRGYLTYWYDDGYWTTVSYDITDLTHRKKLSKSKVLH